MALQNNGIIAIREYLSKTLYIPTYQRDYSWEETELEDFWVDLESIAENDEEHFFGQVVVHNDAEEKKQYIIDGQQRTTSSVIFLRALQKVYAENEIIKDTEDAKAIIQDIASLIGRKTRNSNELHLVLTNADKDFFISNIQTGYPISKKEKKKSQERMRFAFCYFEQKIINTIENLKDEDDILDKLEAFFKAFRDRFKILYMEASELSEAFIIFETLNARGKELETADLLKNYIFSKANNVKDAENKWFDMITTLDGIDPTKYIRHLWNSIYEFAREKELYKRIIRTIDTPKKSKLFLEEMALYSIVYHDLSTPNDCNYFSNGRLKESLITLKNLKASSFYPVVLALSMQNFTEEDIADIVETIETYTFRNFSIGGKVANSSEKLFAKLAKDISDQVFIEKAKIQETIRLNMLGDDEFGNLFYIWKASNSSVDKYVVRYIFRKIHKYLSTTSEIVLDNDKVHIEHIMPQDGTKWASISQEEHDAYLWRLGNLALLDASLNREMQNKPFDEKKVYFEKSEIKPNNVIATKNKWDRKEIETRQKQLTEYALKIWK